MQKADYFWVAHGVTVRILPQKQQFNFMRTHAHTYTHIHTRTGTLTCTPYEDDRLSPLKT